MVRRNGVDSTQAAGRTAYSPHISPGNLYAEAITRRAELYSMQRVRIGGKCIIYCQYADDMTLIADKKEDLTNLLVIIKGNNEVVEVVDSYIFMSSKIDSSDSCDGEIRRRLVLGKPTMANLGKIWKDKDVTIGTKKYS